MGFLRVESLVLMILFFFLFFCPVHAQPANFQSKKFSGIMVFLANIDGNWDLFVWEGGKKRPERLTKTPWDEKFPCIAPSRKLVAYSTTEGRLFLMDLEKHEMRPLDLGDYPGKWEHPAFSPDGKKLICSYFEPEEQDRAVLAMIDIESLQVRFLFPQYGPQFSPVWSPTDSRIAYAYTHCSAACGGIIQEIWMADVSKKISRQLALTHSHCLGPAWSPDGKEIAFSADIGGNFDIWMVDVKSRELTQLTQHSALDESPAFGPDAKHVAFISTRSGKMSVWVKNLDTEKVIEFLPFEKGDIECKDLEWK